MSAAACRAERWVRCPRAQRRLLPLLRWAGRRTCQACPAPAVSGAPAAGQQTCEPGHPRAQGPAVKGALACRLGGPPRRAVCTRVWWRARRQGRGGHACWGCPAAAALHPVEGEAAGWLELPTRPALPQVLQQRGWVLRMRMRDLLQARPGCAAAWHAPLSPLEHQIQAAAQQCSTAQLSAAGRSPSSCALAAHTAGPRSTLASQAG